MCAETINGGILKTKIYPPRLPRILERESLIAELAQARRAKLTTIVAGAGYGKTTLAVEFLHGLGCPYAWYQLGEEDCDLSVFLAYLVAGIENACPGFGARTREYIAAADSVARQSRSILSTLISELDELIGEGLFVALDDFQAVNECPQVVEALDFLLAHLMPGLHFVVFSRSVPRLDLTRLRASRELLELTERDLRFSEGEASALFRDVFAMPLADAEIAALEESTEGWVSGLVLFYLAHKGKDPERVREALRASALYPSATFEYFSKAAYDNQPEALRDFAARTSVLSRMNPAFCDQLLGISNSREMFGRLLEKRLFTVPLDDRGKWYRYHPGLRAFLQGILRERYAARDITELHLRAADLWYERGDSVEALEHFLNAEAFEQAADLLEEISEEWMAAGRVTFLDRGLLRLPVEVLNARPKLLQISAVTAEVIGDMERCITAALASGEAFGRIGQQEEWANSQTLLVPVLVTAGQFDEAEATIAAAYAIMPPVSQFRFALMASESQLRLFQGDSGEAMQLAEEVLRNIAAIEEPRLKVEIPTLCACTLFFDGRTGRALEVSMTGIEAARAAGFRSLAVPFTYMYAVMGLAMADRLREADEIAEEATALGRELDLPTMIMLSHVTRAFVKARSGEYKASMEDASFAEGICKDLGVLSQIAFTGWFLADSYATIGEHAASLEQVVLFKDCVKDMWGIRKIAALMEVACRFEELGPQAVIKRVEDILEELGPHGMGLVRSYACALRFRAEIALGHHKKAVAVLSDYVDEFGQDVILRLGSCVESAPILAPFTDLFAQGRHLYLMERVYRLGGRESLSHLRALIASGGPEVKERARGLAETISRETAPPLHLRLLGRFELGREERTILPEEWKSHKALTLLKFLAVNRNSGLISRDMLMDLLWPDFTPASAAKSLNTALSSIRRTLDPGADRGQSSYLVSSGGSLALELGAGGWTDVELFQGRLSQASEARQAGDYDACFQALQEAEELYGGDLLCDQPHQDWCALARESLRDDYLALLGDLATEYERRGEDDDAQERLEKILLADLGREDVYRRMMVIHSRAGNRSGIEETFRRCDRYLHDRYDVRPSAVTVELYEKLRKS